MGVYYTFINNTLERKITVVTEDPNLTEFNGIINTINYNPTDMPPPTEKDYSIFKIPKKSNPNKFREITAPCDELKQAQSFIVGQFERMRILSHDAAFAYVRGRSTYNAVQRHQANLSRWFLKIDLEDFFPSHNREYILRMMDMVYPLNHMTNEKRNTICDLALLNDKLPQGSPFSPMLTNILFTPIDYEIAEALQKNFIYTRYADDLIISNVYDFNYKTVVHQIEEILRKFNTPFKINFEKVHYGSSSGRNWCLGWMLNKENKITPGWRERRKFKQQVYEMCKASLVTHQPWTPGQVAALRSLGAYYAIVDKGWVNHVYNKYSEKFQTNVRLLMKHIESGK